MTNIAGKYREKQAGNSNGLFYALVPLSFFLIEVFAFVFLAMADAEESIPCWQLAFGGLWSVLFSCLIRILPGKSGRIAYGILYVLALLYAGFQTGYYILFSEMMWISDFRYAAEGSDYISVLLSYPVLWYLGIGVLLGLGVVTLWKYPQRPFRLFRGAVMVALAASAVLVISQLPSRVFDHDKEIQYAGSDYGRAQSAEAAYENMFNTHRLYQVCGLYHTVAKDIYANGIYPHTPAYTRAQAQARQDINGYLDGKETAHNAMTGLLKGKNVILVLMESMDDWMIGEHTPTLQKLMKEGINFTRFYTPVYGGIRTFNTEFCINTGSFLSSQGGYAFDYVTNTYNQSLASVLTAQGYSAKTFHYNDPSFYSRGVFSPAMGYEEYVCYGDYLTDLDEEEQKQALYDDLLLFTDADLREEFFREGKPTLNFIITRSAHLSYKYNEVLSYWGLKKYPEYKGLTGNEETDCALLKARLVDDMFREMLTALEEEGQLENTVIIGVTDHYTYGYKDMESLLALSGVEEELLLEKTPCFIWSADLKPMKVSKILNTSDLLPTVLNLLGVDSGYTYMGNDAFDKNYDGFVPFSNGSWISGNVAYDASADEYIYLKDNAVPVTEEFASEMSQRVASFIEINNLILETDYYKH